MAGGGDPPGSTPLGTFRFAGSYLGDRQSENYPVRGRLWPDFRIGYRSVSPRDTHDGPSEPAIRRPDSLGGPTPQGAPAPPVPGRGRQLTLWRQPPRRRAPLRLGP